LWCWIANGCEISILDFKEEIMWMVCSEGKGWVVELG
jgi:hypothetical protein